MKHYRTRLELTWDDKQYSKGQLAPSALTPVVSQWLAAHGLDPNTVYDFDATLDEPFSYGFTGMSSELLIDLLTHVAHAFPEVHFYTRGAGESFGDMWLREFHQGEVIFAAGPYHVGDRELEKKRGWFSKLFS